MVSLSRSKKKTRPTRTAVLYTSAFSGARLIPLGTSHRMICAAGASPQSAQVARRLLRAVPRRRNFAVVTCPTQRPAAGRAVRQRRAQAGEAGRRRLPSTVAASATCLDGSGFLGTEHAADAEPAVSGDLLPGNSRQDLLHRYESEGPDDRRKGPGCRVLEGEPAAAAHLHMAIALQGLPADGRSRRTTPTRLPPLRRTAPSPTGTSRPSPT